MVIQSRKVDFKVKVTVFMLFGGIDLAVRKSFIKNTITVIMLIFTQLV